MAESGGLSVALDVHQIALGREEVAQFDLTGTATVNNHPPIHRCEGCRVCLCDALHIVALRLVIVFRERAVVFRYLIYGGVDLLYKVPLHAVPVSATE